MIQAALNTRTRSQQFLTRRVPAQAAADTREAEVGAVPHQPPSTQTLTQASASFCPAIDCRLSSAPQVEPMTGHGAVCMADVEIVGIGAQRPRHGIDLLAIAPLTKTTWTDIAHLYA